MRMLMFIKLPVEPFNGLVRNGTASATMKKILDDIKPEAAYFTSMDGCRGGVVVVNMDHASDIPRLAEPWFLNFNAEVTFEPAMTPADLAHANLDALGKQWS
ncbi:MAG TPA: hypothetical protein VG267_02840 [Terracidiphilus sp.]|jgi:hypothetical protein|nr:hypothetical protein [Terracidiphilus sp.]